MDERNVSMDDGALETRVPELWGRPGFLVRRLHQISVAIFLGEMGATLTPLQYGALTVVARLPGIEQFALSEELGIDRVNAGDIIRRLMNNELIRRETSKIDRRSNNLFLTTKGAKLLKACGGSVQQIQDRFLAPLSGRQQQIFIKLCLRLIRGNNSYGRARLRMPSQRVAPPRREG